MREPTDILLERYLLDELPAAAKAALTRRLAADPALRARLDDVRADDERFARCHDAGAFARTLRERMRREEAYAAVRAQGRDPARGRSPVAGWKPVPTNFAGWKPAVGGLFLVALIAVPAWRVLNGESSLMPPGIQPEAPGTRGALIVENPDRERDAAPADVKADAGTATMDHAGTRPDTPPASQTPPEGPREEPARALTEPPPASAPAERLASNRQAPSPAADREGTRLKGLQPTLALFRRTPDGAEPLRPGAAVKPGDILRVGYRAAGRPFGAIFSVDGHGNVTRHWPLTGDRAARLAGGETLLPGAFELDDAPSHERFYLLVSDREFDLKPLLAALHALRAPTEDGVEVIRFDLFKENGI